MNNLMSMEMGACKAVIRLVKHRADGCNSVGIQFG